MKDINKDGLVNEADLIEINKKKIGVSEFIPSAYRKEGDYFSVKIEDLSSRIYVNMEDHQFLQEILQNLAEELDLAPAVGEKIYENRPYVSPEEVKTKAGLTDAEYKKIKQYITVFGWCDKTVVKPVPLTERVGNPAIGSILDGWEQLRPRKIEFPRKTPSGGYVGEGDIVGRAPVNINTASKEVLVALIRDLKGTYFREPAQSFNRIYPSSWYFGLGTHYNAGYTMIQPYTKMGRVLETTPIDRDIALQIADKITENRNLTPTPEDPTDYRGLFRSWHQFNLFVDNALIT
ncbi:MAG: hypothetical protein HY762_05435, partial [Planctomycetes bacterium]|nr:hypothetical protein [Planctomycetota bacterium]